jgi:hypothetical protein
MFGAWASRFLNKRSCIAATGALSYRCDALPACLKSIDRDDKMNIVRARDYSSFKKEIISRGTA